MGMSAAAVTAACAPGGVVAGTAPGKQDDEWGHRHPINIEKQIGMNQPLSRRSDVIHAFRTDTKYRVDARVECGPTIIAANPQSAPTGTTGAAPAPDTIPGIRADRLRSRSSWHKAHIRHDGDRYTLPIWGPARWTAVIERTNRVATISSANQPSDKGQAVVPTLRRPASTQADQALTANSTKRATTRAGVNTVPAPARSRAERQSDPNVIPERTGGSAGPAWRLDGRAAGVPGAGRRRGRAEQRAGVLRPAPAAPAGCQRWVYRPPSSPVGISLPSQIWPAVDHTLWLIESEPLPMQRHFTRDGREIVCPRSVDAGNDASAPDPYRGCGGLSPLGQVQGGLGGKAWAR